MAVTTMKIPTWQDRVKTKLEELAQYRPTDKLSLYLLGRVRAERFCRLNNLPSPAFNCIPSIDWVVSACAYYRPDTEVVRKWTTPGINICLEKCAPVATDNQVRNWNWPGSVTDREPFGVIAHELGHHVDWLTGERKGSYFSEYCEKVFQFSGESPISSYGNTNPAEWFAEMFRLFVTNHALLKILKPRVWEELRRKFQPVSSDDWIKELGDNVPTRILNNLKSKVRKVV